MNFSLVLLSLWQMFSIAQIPISISLHIHDTAVSILYAKIIAFMITNVAMEFSGTMCTINVIFPKNRFAIRVKRTRTILSKRKAFRQHLPQQ